jgi:hypothetical protein
MRILAPEERHDFFTLHLEHRLTALLAFVCRLSDTEFWQGNGDLFRSALEGSGTMLRVFIEFLGVRSKRQDSDLFLVPYEALGDDITIESFGVARLAPEAFGEHARSLPSCMKESRKERCILRGSQGMNIRAMSTLFRPLRWFFRSYTIISIARLVMASTSTLTWRKDTESGHADWLDVSAISNKKA